MFEFGIFAFVTSITPGPNNSMLMASGIRFGRKKSLPHFFGIWLGFNFLFFLGGNLLSYFPEVVFQYLQYAGYIVIIYIAYKIALTKSKQPTIECLISFVVNSRNEISKQTAIEFHISFFESANNKQ